MVAGKAWTQKPLRLAGWLAVAASVVLGGYTAWHYFDPLAAGRQENAREALAAQWGHRPTGAPLQVAEGRPFALLRIPRLWGAGSFAVVEGTSEADLAIGPAHFTGTALPGQVGNFAIAGHTIGGGDPFTHMNTMKPGDEITVETQAETDIYQVSTAPFVISARNVGVLEPVQDEPGQPPKIARITIVSCIWPDTGNDDHRLATEGVLTKRIEKP